LKFNTAIGAKEQRTEAVATVAVLAVWVLREEMRLGQTKTSHGKTRGIFVALMPVQNAMAKTDASSHPFLFVLRARQAREMAKTKNAAPVRSDPVPAAWETKQ
jgi:hypothetical protein